MLWFLRARKERRLVAVEEFRQARKLVDEDVTVFGEQLAELHVDTLTTELDPDMRWDYQRSLDLYEESKAALAAARDGAAVLAITTVLDDGRFHLACVLARRDGVDLPDRREPCFFNPQHGPATADVRWTPPQGVEREIPVCRADLLRIEGGEAPDVRLVRVGDRYVPWYAAHPLQPGGAGGSIALLTGRRAHVMGNRSTRLTDQHIAEATMRAGGTTSSSGGGMGGFSI